MTSTMRRRQHDRHQGDRDARAVREEQPEKRRAACAGPSRRAGRWAAPTVPDDRERRRGPARPASGSRGARRPVRLLLRADVERRRCRAARRPAGSTCRKRHGWSATAILAGELGELGHARALARGVRLHHRHEVDVAHRAVGEVELALHPRGRRRASSSVGAVGGDAEVAVELAGDRDVLGEGADQLLRVELGERQVALQLHARAPSSRAACRSPCLRAWSASNSGTTISLPASVPLMLSVAHSGSARRAAASSCARVKSRSMPFSAGFNARFHAVAG